MRYTQIGKISLLVLAMFCFTLPAGAYSDTATRFFTEGNTLVLAKNYTQAVSAYDRAIALEPGYFEAWDRQADALNRDGKFSEALAASSQALEINPRYAAGWINRGQILYNIGYYYEDQLHDPKRAESYYTEQLAAFEKAIEIDPTNADAWFNKGYALAGMKRYDEALASFDTVRSLDPDYPNLGLSQKQATVLRDAATPAYVRYAIPIIGGTLLILALGGYFLYQRKKTRDASDDAVNRKMRRKKERGQ